MSRPNNATIHTTPVRILVLLSGSGSSFRYLYAHDPNFGKLYAFVGVFSDVPGVKGIDYAEAAGIPTHVIDFDAWRKERGIARDDLTGREAYFADVLRIAHESRADAILLSGFMRRITEPLLSAFAGRILNVHPALLSIRDGEVRKYTGLNVVARAITAGDPTGSTVHIVTDEPDTGPIIAESAPLPYERGVDPAAHQERMKTACDGPAYQTALEKLIKSGWPAKPWELN